MAVTITGVEPKSHAAKKRIRAGWQLLALNGHTVEDVLDYRFYLAEEKLQLRLFDGKKERLVTIRKEESEDIGLEFETYLMDAQRSCRNKCVFCFIDQLPPGMRETLYFKDDDSRLSFLFGNYITLTNLSDRDVERILTMHISPINVSVHTTDPALRCKMMNNRFAGDRLSILKRLAEAGIDLQCQLVLVPGWNDGEALEKSLRDLAALAPAIKSVAAVPVGLTRFREGLEPLRLFTAEESVAVIDCMEKAAKAQLAATGNRLFYPSDEFFLKAGRPLPEADYYGEFGQLENGVGMCALLRQQFLEALASCDEAAAGSRLLIATGALAAPLIRNLVDEAQKKWHNLCVVVCPIRNDFCGETITVSGLVTGQDIATQLQGKAADRLLFPDNMLRREGDCFLDDMTPEVLSDKLGMPVTPVGADGADLLEALLL
ncbi:MAG: DUF512 domain-containing protein [Clostridia bacterium]|nr:DUF512 domain-containing protein [Clostridia bacterium]